MSITHWSYDHTETACAQKLAAPYIGYQMTPDGIPGPVRLQKMFEPKYVSEHAKIDTVNCPACIAVMKLTMWHCIYHGFVIGKGVTFAENCAICGNPV